MLPNYWLDFTASVTQTYFFHFQGDETTNFYVEKFSNVALGHSTVGRDHVYYVNGTNITTGQKVVFFSLSLNQNQHVFYRVRGEGYCPIDINYGLGDISIYINHSHVYNDYYVWQSYTQHYAFCSCGSSVLQGHVVSGSNLMGALPDAGGNLNVPCLLCGGMARIGFLPGYLFANQLNGQSYYVSDSGVIVLNDL